MSVQIRELKDNEGNVFYPLTDVHAIGVNGAPAFDEKPTKNSDGIVRSGGVFDEITTNGSAFDVTVYNSGQTYTSLSEALNAVPADYKKGGMSIKYVQTSDNKYIQCRLTADKWSTDINDWQSQDLEQINLLLKFPSFVIYNSYYDTNGIVRNDSGHVYRRLPLLPCNGIVSIYILFQAGCRLYDANQNYLRSVSIRANSLTKVSFGSDVAYFGIYWHKASAEADEYDYSSCFIELSPTIISSLTERVEKFVPSKNILNYETLVDGYISSSSGLIRTDTDRYKTTDFIPVKAGEPIAISHFRFFLAYSSDGNTIENTYINDSTYNYVFTPTQDGYVRATLFVDELNAYTVQIEYSSEVTDYQFPGYVLGDNISVERYERFFKELLPNNDFINEIKPFTTTMRLSNGWFKDYVIYNYYYDTSGQKKEDSEQRYRILPIMEVPDGVTVLRIRFNEKSPGLRCYDASGGYIGSAESQQLDNNESIFTLVEGTKLFGLYWRKNNDDYSDAYLVFDGYGDVIPKRLRRLERQSSPNIVKIDNSDKIAIIGDSYTESHYSVINKAYINKLSLFSDFEFVNWGVSGDVYLGRLNSIRQGCNHYGSISFKDIAPKYAMMCCYTNDVKYMNINDYIKCLDDICTVILGLGTTPIICTEYHTGYSSENNTNVKTALKFYAESHGYLFWDIATYADLMRKSASNKYAPFWGGSHAGTRTNAIESDPYEMYLKGLERPEKSLKLFRLRQVALPANLDDILFKTNEDRARLFMEINVGHTRLKDPTSVDNCTNANYEICGDEYQSLQLGSTVSFDNACLISCVLPAISKNVSSVSLNLTSSSGIDKVYVLNRLASPYNTYERYARFDYTAMTTAPQVGDTYETNGTTYTVVKVVEGMGDSGSLGSILCTPSTINNNTGGTLTRVSGSGDVSIPYSYKAVGYDISNVNSDTCGHWEELSGEGGVYEIQNVRSCIENDKVHFLITGTNININNVFVEFDGTIGKRYNQKQIVLEYNMNNSNQELLPSNTFAAVGTLDSNWNVTTSDIYEHIHGSDAYPVGCNSMVKVTDAISLACVVDKANLKPFKNTAWLEVWCRYFPDIYSDGSGNQITESSYDYNDIVVEVGTGSRIIKLKERVNTHWKIVRMPIVISDNLSDLHLNIKSDTNGIEVTYISLKYE